MEIAKGVYSEDWKNLDLENSEADWQKAVDILESRFNERFFEPISILLQHEEQKEAKDKKYGFTILAIDMLLIETLQAFKEGKENTDGSSRKMFYKFIDDSEELSRFFNSDELKKMFYEDIRCGVLHQAEIQNKKLRIWTIGNLYEDFGDFSTLNRIRLHEIILNEFQKYIKDLKEKSNADLRKYFKKKMDYIVS